MLASSSTSPSSSPPSSRPEMSRTDRARYPGHRRRQPFFARAGEPAHDKAIAAFDLTRRLGRAWAADRSRGYIGA